MAWHAVVQASASGSAGFVPVVPGQSAIYLWAFIVAGWSLSFSASAQGSVVVAAAVGIAGLASEPGILGEWQ